MTQLLNYLMGFLTAILAIYVKKSIDDKDLRRRSLFALINEAQNNLAVLEKTARVYLLTTIAWDTMHSYLAEKETDLFARLSEFYSAVNLRNNVMMLHNTASCLGRISRVEVDGYVFSGEWLDHNADQLKRDAREVLGQLNERLSQLADCP